MSFCTPGSFMGIARRPLRSELSDHSALLRKPYFGIAAVNAVFKIIPQQEKAAIRHGKLPPVRYSGRTPSSGSGAVGSSFMSRVPSSARSLSPGTAAMRLTMPRPRLSHR